MGRLECDDDERGKSEPRGSKRHKRFEQGESVMITGRNFPANVSTAFIKNRSIKTAN